MNNVIEKTIYFHRSKEDNYDLAGEIGLDEKLMDDFKYMGSEITITVWINKDTGETWATHLNGMPLTAKVRI